MTSSVFLSEIADRLRCGHGRAEQILRAVLQALRDGLNADESASVESSLPSDLRNLWPQAAGPHPGLADLGDTGFLGRVQQLASSPTEDETKRIVEVVMSLLMTKMATAGGDRAAAWSALTHLPREKKALWMKLFRAACFPVELIAQRPVKVGRRFSKNARTPSR